MSEPKRISPLLDGFVLGGAISEHHGVSCYPAIQESTGERYIVKIISIPASQNQADALLLTGACSDREQVLAYFQELTDGVAGETDKLLQLSKQEGFVPHLGHQIQQKEDGVGFDIYLLSRYTPSLQVMMHTQPLTHLAAVNLGLDMCAALAACRRSGYLYVDLKPENIFPSDTQGYRIGDLGFIPLASLKYASLPEKYRSSYTAPEVSDALSTLNATMDVYALGLILYQVYNNGQLPFAQNAPASGLPAPLYADYEMAEIILRACAADPADRWQDPVQMGQALVDYMQRNSVNDEPVIPAPVVFEEPEETPECFISEEENDEELAQLLAMIPDEQPPVQLAISEDMVAGEDPHAEEPQDEQIVDEVLDETDADQLSFLNDDQPLPEELARILAQADELIAHELPEPVIAPAPIDVPIPVPVVDEPQELEPQEECVPLVTAGEEADEISEEFLAEENDAPTPERRSPRRWIAAAVAALLIILACVGVSVWYQEYYIQHVESFEINCHDGMIHVSVYSDIDDDLLSVVCIDTYGNAMRSKIENGAAVFSDLNPATQYRIRLEISGFHKLVGPTTGTYTTEGETEVSDFTAADGPEDGSVTLHFHVTGPDCEQWTVSYSAENEPEKKIVMTGHSITIYDLTPGNTYTFRLSPSAGRYLTGTTEITYTLAEILIAQNLKLAASGSNALRVLWETGDAPAGQTWIVRCYNNAGYDETVTTSETDCLFENLDLATGYTVEVTAEGKKQGATISVPADPLQVTDFQTNVTAPWAMTLSWEFTGTAPAGGWILHYSINGGQQINVTCSENQSEILLIPNAGYVFTVSAADHTLCFTDVYSYGPVDVTRFEGYGVTADDMTLSTVLKPDKSNWNRNDLSADDYRASFTAEEKISILAHLSKTYNVSDQMIATTYVVRDGDGRLVSLDTESQSWRNMWYQRYCELDLPQQPTQAGNYCVDIYFNDQHVHSLSFTIEEDVQ